MSYRIELQVREFEREDISGLIEQALDAGGDNLRIDKDWGWGAWSLDWDSASFGVTIVDDDGEDDISESCTLNELRDVIVFYACQHGDMDEWESTHNELVVDFGQIDIFDALSIIQIAAFGDVIIS